MKRLMNQPQDVLSDALSGFAAAHANLVSYDASSRIIFRREKKQGRVALISGGGSGHEPMHIGYVGRGMLDAACAGQIFTSPTPDQVMRAVELVDGGAGVLLIVKNYAGDVMNFEMGADLGRQRSAIVLVDDDVAQDAAVRTDQGQRGIAGTVVVEKIVGAAAENGASLEQCADLGRAINKATASMGVALSGSTMPEVGIPTFVLADNEIELGVGIHGEPGISREPMRSADDLADAFLQRILDKLHPEPSEPLLLMCNGLGGTPPIELYTFYQCARERLDRAGYRVERSLVGTFCTALDMRGASLTVTKLDDQSVVLWDAPANTPALRCS